MKTRVYWITGLSGAGKTTVGTRLYYRLKAEKIPTVMLDGDVVKAVLYGEQVDYSLEGRKRRAYQYANLCKMLADQGITVVCCTIAMFNEVRQWNRNNIEHYTEVFIDVDVDILKARDAKGLYEKYATGSQAMVGLDGEDIELPQSPDVRIHNTMDDKMEAYAAQIMNLAYSLEESNPSFVNYWNGIYSRALIEEAPSDFARFICPYVKRGKKLIDLGCGNGRDSIFFQKNGVKVTAVDSSEEAIKQIDARNLPIFTVCGDFVKTKALFSVDYHYCYSRWTIHAINSAQQDEMLHNVYSALRDGGYFFIEVRTIHDAKYGQGTQIGPDAYIFDGHYRRFIRPGQLLPQLKAAGFDIVFSDESDGYSIVGSDKPTLLRVIAQKTQH